MYYLMIICLLIFSFIFIYIVLIFLYLFKDLLFPNRLLFICIFITYPIMIIGKITGIVIIQTSFNNRIIIIIITIIIV